MSSVVVAGRARTGRVWRVGVVCVGLLLALVWPSHAFAGVSRPFVRQIAGTPSGPGAATVPFGEVRGVALDAAENVWVSERYGPFAQFSGAGGFEKLVVPTFPSKEAEERATSRESLAIDRANGDFYISGVSSGVGQAHLEAFDGSGALFERSLVYSQSHVAIDNSQDSFDLSAGSVYVAHGPDPEAPFGDGAPVGITKLNAAGEPVDFTNALGEPVSLPYVKGNEIVGIPGEEPFSTRGDSLAGVTVDGEGDIFVVYVGFASNAPLAKEEGAVVEFNAEGRFVRAYTGDENPGLGEDHRGWGTGAEGLRGVAVDPSNGNVLVSITTGNHQGAIDEFEPSGRFVEQIGQAGGAVMRGAWEMAIDSTGLLYVIDPTANVLDVFGAAHVLARVTLSSGVERGRTEATVSGSVDPEGVGLSGCRFEVVPMAQYEQDGFASVTVQEQMPCSPSAGSIPPDSATHVVTASAGGLVSGETYYYRLVAISEGALGGTAVSDAFAFTTPHAPVVVSADVTNISSKYADLHATIAPLGAETAYRFEYSADGVTWTSAPVPDADIGAGGPTGGGRVSVLQQVGPLQAGTTYRVRVVASNTVEGSVETTVGPEGGVTFDTMPENVAGLPDGRRYELVTPVNKGSAEDMFAHGAAEPNYFENRDTGYPSASGGEFMLETFAAFGAFGASGNNAYVFRREGEGWSTVPLSSPALGLQSVSPTLFDPETGFARVGVQDESGSGADREGARLLDLLGPPGGPYGTVYAQEEGQAGELVGSSRDLSRVILQTGRIGLTGDTTQKAGDALYEWDEGSLSLVSVDPQGEAFECGAWLGKSRGPGATHGAVSADGSRVFFTAPDPYALNQGPACWNGKGENTPQLYMRAHGQTIRVSQAAAGVSDPTGAHPAVFVGAARDGSRVFFVSTAELTAYDAGIHDPELYEYDVETGSLTRISKGDTGNAAADVRFVPAMSADGGVVYFAAFGQLAPGATTLPDTGHAVNLYRYDASTGTTAYIARIDTRDYPNSAAVAWWSYKEIDANELALASNANWYTTPDGRYLVFASTAEVTSYSTAEQGTRQCPVLDVEENDQFGHCSEVYRYDAVAAQAGEDALACVSCDRSGARPVSDAFFGHGAGGQAATAGPVRAMSDNGAYVFFDSSDPLVPQATNGTNDVYEWETEGTGGCAIPEGCVRLIGSGEDPWPSFFLGSSADGANVFFGTHARLAPQDTDSSGDLYDARIGGGFGVPAGQGPCEGDACQSPAGQSVDQTPASMAFAAPPGVGQAGETGAGTIGAPSVVGERRGSGNAGKLAAALRACRHKPRKQRRRRSCEGKARKRYASEANHAARARRVVTIGGTVR